MTDTNKAKVRQAYEHLPYTATMSELEDRIKALVYDNHRLETALGEAVKQLEITKDQLVIMRAANETFGKANYDRLSSEKA